MYTWFMNDSLCSIFAFVEVTAAVGFLAFFLLYKMLLEAQQIAFIDEARIAYVVNHQQK